VEVAKATKKVDYICKQAEHKNEQATRHADLIQDPKAPAEKLGRGALLSPFIAKMVFHTCVMIE
jgi:hypothetical protein